MNDKKNIVITGASGFIGEKLADFCISKGHSISCLSRKVKTSTPDIQYILGDLTKKSVEISRLLINTQILFHCAGELSKMSEMRSAHVLGVKNLLEAIEQDQIANPKPVFQWIQLSSCGAYGQNAELNHLPRFVDEETPNNPDGEYEVTKTEADDLIIDFASRHPWFKYTIIRPTIVFGYGMKSSLILRITKMIRRGIFFYIGHKDAIVNFVHVDDVVEAMHLAMMNKSAYNQTFIISNDCRLEDFINTIAKVVKKNSPKIVINESLLRAWIRFANKFFKLPINESQIDVLTRRTYYNNHKISNLLNWAPKKHILLQLEEFMLNYSK